MKQTTALKNRAQHFLAVGLLASVFSSSMAHAGWFAPSSPAIPVAVNKPVKIDAFDTVTDYCAGAMAAKVATEKINGCVAVPGLGTASCSNIDDFGIPDVTITIGYQSKRRIVLYKFPGGDFGTFAYHSISVKDTVFSLPRGEELPYFQYDVKRNIRYDANGQYAGEDDYAQNVSIQIPMNVSEKTVLKSEHCDDPQGMEDGKCTVVVNTSEYLQCLQDAYADLNNTSEKTCESAALGLGYSPESAKQTCQN